MLCFMLSEERLRKFIPAVMEQDRAVDTHTMQYCRFKIKSKKVEGKLGKITFVSGKDVVGSL